MEHDAVHPDDDGWRLIDADYLDGGQVRGEGCRMSEIASHILQEGMVPVRLHGGPWDGKEVWVRDSKASRVLVNGPRHGDHSVWITHLYQRREGRYESCHTEVTPLSAWRISMAPRFEFADGSVSNSPKPTPSPLGSTPGGE